MRVPHPPTFSAQHRNGSRCREAAPGGVLFQRLRLSQVWPQRLHLCLRMSIFIPVGNPYEYSNVAISGAEVIGSFEQ